MRRWPSSRRRARRGDRRVRRRRRPGDHRPRRPRRRAEDAHGPAERVLLAAGVDAGGRRRASRSCSPTWAQAPSRVAARPQHHRRHDDHGRAGPPAREGARSGRRPTARTSTRSRSRCSSSRACCSRSTSTSRKQQVADLFPYVRKVITGPGRPHLRVVVVDRPARALPPHGPRAARAAHLGRADRRAQGGREEGPEGRRLPVQRRPLGGDDVRQPRLLLVAGREAARRRTARRCSPQGANRADMLNVFKLLRRTITSGVTPSRVTTFNTYDEFSTAAQAGTRGDVPRRLVPVADDAVAAAEGRVQEVGGLRAARARSPGKTATGTGGWSMAAFSKDPAKVAACMDIVKSIYAGPGNTVTGELPTSRRLFDNLKAFQAPIFKTFRRFLRARGAAARACRSTRRCPTSCRSRSGAC